MDEITRQLAQFSASLNYAEIPDEVVHKAKLCLVDALGCMYGGKNCDGAVIWRKYVNASDDPGYMSGRAIGVKGWMPADHAAFINCLMVRYLDYNDSWQGGHPSDLIGGLLALAESAKADGPRLLTAMIVSYEVMLRLIRSAKMGDRGFDQGFVLGIASVCGLGNLLQLPVEKIAHAIGSITCANIPLRANRSGKLSNWKAVATPFAVRNAVSCVLLAAEGLTGPDSSFSGRHGLFQQITGPFELEPFPREGGPWLTKIIRLKYWPAELHSQIGIWAALELRKKIPPEDIKQIKIDTYEFCWFEIGSEPAKWEPTTRETADHSLPYIFARAMFDGTVVESIYEDTEYSKPVYRPLMNAISIEKNEELESRFPAEMAMRIEATAKDGRTEKFEMANPRGDPKNPMTDDEVSAKFRRLADSTLGADGASKVLDNWWSIEKRTNLTAVLDLLEF